jgi:putative zinc finger protein
VNRLLTEGRRTFLRRVAGIERGAECERYEPLLSALADGEASRDDLAALRPHMKTCLSCRAALREFRAMADRVASVVPAAAFAAGSHGSPVRELVESVLGAAQHRAASMGDRLHAAAELATGQKVAAVAASAAALAGGGTAIDQFANHGRVATAAHAAQVAQDPRPPEPPADAPADPSLPVAAPPGSPSDTPPPSDPSPASAPAATPPPEPAPPPPSPANEFDPTGAPAPGPASAPSPQPAAAGPSAAPGSGGGGGSGGAGSGEFAP